MSQVAGGPFAGAVDAVLRALSHEGEAEILSSPTIVVTQGVPAVVSARLLLPATLFHRSGGAGATVVARDTVSEEAGVRLEVTAEWIGRDHLVLRLHPWVRQLTLARLVEIQPSNRRAVVELARLREVPPPPLPPAPPRQ